MITTALADPFGSVSTIRGLMTAYLKGDEKVMANIFFGGITLASIALGIGGVLTGMQAAAVGGAWYKMDDLSNPARVENFMYETAWLLAWLGGMKAVDVGRNLLSTNFNRMKTGWDIGQLSRKLNDAAYHMTQNLIGKKPDGMEENKDGPKDPYSPTEIAKTIDKTVTESVEGANSGWIGLYMGILGAAFGIGTAGYQLAMKTLPVEGWEFFGQYGMAAYAATLAIPTIVVTTYGGWKIANFMAKVKAERLQAEGEYRIYARDNIANAFQISAMEGQHIQNGLQERTYKAYDTAWRRWNYASTGYTAYKSVIDPITSHVLVLLPVAGAVASGTIPPDMGLQIAGVIAGAWNRIDLLMDILPDIKNAQVHSRRQLALLDYMRAVENPPEFYRKTGTSEFAYSTQPLVRGISITDLKLMHEDKDAEHKAEPYLTIPSLKLRPGDWATLAGPSGCGKTHAMMALLGARLGPDGRRNLLNGYGSGEIVTGAGAKFFYFPQHTVFEPISLKGLISYPTQGEEAFSDREVIAMMREVGLEKYIPNIHDVMYQGKIWNNILSGGERKKLMAARGLLKNADVILMDEPDAGLDPASKENFYKLYKKHCGGSIMICITHEAPPPMDNGEPYFNVNLKVQDGVMTENRINAFDRHLRLVGSGYNVPYGSHVMQGPPVL